MNPTTPNDIAAVLRKARRVLVFTHSSPDGDAIGSILGFGWIMATRPTAVQGSTTLVCAGDGVPAQYQSLPGADRIVSFVPSGTWDVAVALDASDPRRLGDVFHSASLNGVPLIVIDHHVTNLQFGTLNWIDSKAAATAQIVADLADAMGAPITTAAATCLLTGLVTDTLGFRTSNVTLEVMSTVTRLMRLGANLAEITEQTLNYKPLAVMRLWGQALVGLQKQGNVIWASITQDMRARVNAHENGDIGLVSFLLSAPEARVAAVFTEKVGGQIEVSLRARPGHDVSQIALSLGGGGHPQASGCTVSGPLAAAEARLVPLLLAASLWSSE